MATGGGIHLKAGRETSTLKEMERKMKMQDEEPGEDLSALKSLLGRNL